MSDDISIRYKLTYRQIIVFAERKGITADQWEYPRTRAGLNRAQRKIQALIDTGGTLVDEALMHTGGGQ